MSSYTYRDRQLWVESVPFQRLAETYGTPLYVYSTRTILDDLRRIEGAFDGLPHLTYYAVKANANRAVLRLIAGEGLGADAGSKGELYLALSCGFPPSKITFSGVGKRDDEIAYALEHRILAFYAESTEEISVIDQIAGQMGTRAAVLLRVNLDIDAGGHAYVSTSMKHNKFGIPHGDAPEVLRWASGLPHIEVRGIHSHIGSQILRPMTFLRAAEAVADVVRTLRAAGIPLHDLDFGGGFGIQYHGYVTHPELPQEASEAPAISSRVLLQPAIDVLKGLDCSISIQPGRALVAHAGVLLTRVLYRKETATKTFLIVDGAMTDLIRPSLYHAHHQIVPLALNHSPHETVDVVGPVCESADFLAQDRVLPQMQRNDILAVMCAGAYGFVMSSTYNARPRIAEVLVDGDTHTVVRPRERIEDL
jgi:diaminopimelate decarboxylase